MSWARFGIERMELQEVCFIDLSRSGLFLVGIYPINPEIL